jgi:hypothetical protein
MIAALTGAGSELKKALEIRSAGGAHGG